MLDEYTDKLYDQFVPEGGKQQRKLLKEEREKIKKEEENAAQVKMVPFHFSQPEESELYLLLLHDVLVNLANGRSLGRCIW